MRVQPRAGGGHAYIELRPDTYDADSLFDVFVNGAYVLSSLPCWPHLSSICSGASNPIILDLGANVGFSALALHWQLPRARIMAVEPEAGNFERLCQNTAGIPEIVPVQAAVAATPGWARIANPDCNSLGFYTEAADGPGPNAVRAYTIEQLWELAADGAPTSTPILVKMDVEGAESELFGERCAWLARTPLLIIEPHDYLSTNPVTHGLLQALLERRGNIMARGEHVIAWLPYSAAASATGTNTASAH